MKYLKMGIVGAFALGFVFGFIFFVGSSAGKICMLISALLFIAYLVLRFGYSYPDRGSGALGIASLILGAMALIVSAIMFI